MISIVSTAVVKLSNCFKSKPFERVKPCFPAIYWQIFDYVVMARSVNCERQLVLGKNFTGCHHRPHGRRKKRSSEGYRCVNDYFPACIDVELEISEGTSSTVQTWDGPVSLVVFHTKWYEEIDRTCR